MKRSGSFQPTSASLRHDSHPGPGNSRPRLASRATLRLFHGHQPAWRGAEETIGGIERTRRGEKESVRRFTPAKQTRKSGTSPLGSGTPEGASAFRLYAFFPFFLAAFFFAILDPLLPYARESFEYLRVCLSSCLCFMNRAGFDLGDREHNVRSLRNSGNHRPNEEETQGSRGYFGGDRQDAERARSQREMVEDGEQERCYHDEGWQILPE